MAAAIISELQVKGKYGKYGGQYVPEVLMPALEELEEGYERYKNDPEFLAELDHYLMDFAGRETPLYLARNLSRNTGQRSTSRGKTLCTEEPTS